MIKIFKKKSNKVIEIVSPVTGKMTNLETVPDKVFASKMMGEGVAFELIENTIYSPIEGKVTLIPETKHAIGITGVEGIEILVHIGLDTVNLKGQGFESLIKQGDKVFKGTPILKVDIDGLKEQGIELTTPMVITNSGNYELSIKQIEDVVAGETIVLECSNK